MKLRNLVTAFACLLLLCCNRKPAEDPRIQQFKGEIAALEEQNRQQQDELEELRNRLDSLQLEVQSRQQSRPAILSSEPPVAQKEGIMTSARMKREVSALLEKEIERIKVSTDSPRKENTFGMRIEYDLQHAVYGLVQSKDKKDAYSARVMVPYEKFLQTQKKSRPYGSGTQEFLFHYRNEKWMLEKTQ